MAIALISSPIDDTVAVDVARQSADGQPMDAINSMSKPVDDPSGLMPAGQDIETERKSRRACHARGVDARTVGPFAIERIAGCVSHRVYTARRTVDQAKTLSVPMGLASVQMAVCVTLL